MQGLGCAGFGVGRERGTGDVARGQTSLGRVGVGEGYGTDGFGYGMGCMG